MSETPRWCLEYPLRKYFIAQVVVPRDITYLEALKLCAFIKTLVAPGSEQSDAA